MAHMNNIEMLRQLRGWTQTDLAEVVGTKQPTIARIERGDVGVTLRKLVGIADALEVPLHMLFMDDLASAEVELVRIFRTLPKDRQKGWRDMAALAKADVQQEEQ